jgi:hypothetical protein
MQQDVAREPSFQQPVKMNVMRPVPVIGFESSPHGSQAKAYSSRSLPMTDMTSKHA